MNVRRPVELGGRASRRSPASARATRADWRFGGPALLMGHDPARRAAVLRAQRAGIGPRAPALVGVDRRRQVSAAGPDGGAVPALPGRQGRPCSTAAARSWCPASRSAATGSSSGRGGVGRAAAARHRPAGGDGLGARLGDARPQAARAARPRRRPRGAVSAALRLLADEPPERRTLIAPARVPGARTTTRGRRCATTSPARARTASCSTAWSTATARRRWSGSRPGTSSSSRTRRRSRSPPCSGRCSATG